MPTYTCWSESGLVGPEQKQAVATALTEIHHEVAVAPRYFVQVIFTELVPGSVFLAGQPATRGHVWIRADIRAGRTVEQKRALLERITVEVGAILGLPPEEVWVYVCDIPGSSIAEHGRVLPEPGGEDAWFDALPPDLQERLAALR
ncbi:4-oxalocrotonate tautomerase [Geodermatophilus sp. Leaf369]|uniref:tautomerase family protein n=1 Tax=Geodermatophilus sp. Leaf369 TaxID=1736354 RepID=UPI0006F4EF74|nr:tautomerase family protein [Geodermatophilus sp. Leaf369]KQS60785.1 4-oxalocrotonate tautomerase [Geodermatophilus sp. Leaf369]